MNFTNPGVLGNPVLAIRTMGSNYLKPNYHNVDSNKMSGSGNVGASDTSFTGNPSLTKTTRTVFDILIIGGMIAFVVFLNKQR